MVGVLVVALLAVALWFWLARGAGEAAGDPDGWPELAALADGASQAPPGGAAPGSASPAPAASPGKWPPGAPGSPGGRILAERVAAALRAAGLAARSGSAPQILAGDADHLLAMSRVGDQNAFAVVDRRSNAVTSSVAPGARHLTSGDGTHVFVDADRVWIYRAGWPELESVPGSQLGVGETYNSRTGPPVVPLSRQSGDTFTLAVFASEGGAGATPGTTGYPIRFFAFSVSDAVRQLSHGP